MRRIAARRRAARGIALAIRELSATPDKKASPTVSSYCPIFEAFCVVSMAGVTEVLKALADVMEEEFADEFDGDVRTLTLTRPFVGSVSWFAQLRQTDVLPADWSDERCLGAMSASVRRMAAARLTAEETANFHTDVTFDEDVVRRTSARRGALNRCAAQADWSCLGLTSLEDIRACDVGRLVVCDVCVSRLDERKARFFTSVFDCASCGAR